MRALIFDGSQPRFATDHPDPSPPPGEAVIRPLLAGVCATDLEICRGYMNFQGVLGHEFVGIVESLTKDADAKSRGLLNKRVVGSINCVCETCDMCKRGLANHCRNRTVLGIQKRNGCFADRFILPVRNLLPVPQTLDDQQAVFTEPLAAACEILRQIRVEGKPFITVLGDGRLGLLVAQVMSQLNASVRLIGKHPRKLELCEKWGVKHRLLNEITPHADQDIVVDCTGSPTGLQLAMQLVRPRGRIVLKTTTTNQSTPDLSPLVINEIELIGSRCGPFNEALALLEAGKVDVLSLISRRVRLNDSLEALRAADQPDVIKVLIEFD